MSKSKNGIMHIALLAPSHKSFISEFITNVEYSKLPNGYDGAPFIGTLIKEYLEMGHSVVAITTSVAENDDFKVKEFRDKNFTWVVVPQRKHSFRFNGFRFGRMLDFFRLERKAMLEQVTRIKPDFVHAHWGYEFAHVAYKSGIPYLVTLHDNPYIIARFSRTLYRYFRLIYAEVIFRKLKFKSTVSPYMSDYTARKGGELRIIPNPIKLPIGQEEVGKLIHEKQSSLDQVKFFMILNGWDERKNGIAGLLAFQLLKTKFPKAELHLFGNGSECGGPAERDSLNHNVDNVIFHGAIAHNTLLSMMKEFHLMIHPALEESFGVVLIEAMSFGIPCIGGENSGAVPWVLGDKRLLTDVHSPISIMDSVLVCIENYEELANIVFENVNNRFSSLEIANAYIDYYEEILELC